MVDSVLERRSMIDELVKLNGVSPESGIEFSHNFVTGNIGREEVKIPLKEGVKLPSPAGVGEIFETHGLPCIVDLVRIDIDGMEYARTKPGTGGAETVYTPGGLFR